MDAFNIEALGRGILQVLKHNAGNVHGQDVPQKTGIASNRQLFFDQVGCGSVSANAAYHVS